VGEIINAYSVLVGKPEVNKRLGKSGLRWKDNIKVGLRRQNERM
jgi:hypothetical protein